MLKRWLVFKWIIPIEISLWMKPLKYMNMMVLIICIQKMHMDKKNGAHAILSIKGILENKFKKRDHIIDNCTNVHFESDLMKAAIRMQAMGLNKYN